jgi:hypothetical protein
MGMGQQLVSASVHMGMGQLPHSHSQRRWGEERENMRMGRNTRLHAFCVSAWGICGKHEQFSGDTGNWVGGADGV